MILHDMIVEMNDRFRSLQKKYRDNKYILECQDDHYKDIEENIFNDSRRAKLEQFISCEAQLYRHSYSHYEDIIKIINGLSTDISYWLQSMRGRRFQGISQARKLYDSEMYYLRDMKLRINHYSEILSLLNELRYKEIDLLKNGIEISADIEFEGYLLNKCLLLGQVPYCRVECTKLITELNKRVGNSPFYCGEFYYKLAELNFSLQKYKDSSKLLDKAINCLKRENKMFDTDFFKKMHINDMLFSAYQLKALGYEFCGEYAQAIEFLTGKNINDFIDTIKKNLHDSKISELIYSSDDNNGENYNTSKQHVIKLIDKIVSKNQFDSEVTDFIYDSNSKKIFNDIVIYSNSQTRDEIYNCCSDEKLAQKVYQSNCICVDDVNLLNEFIHILAHCVNEQGVTMLKEQLYCEDESKAEELIIIGRALMLYVSNERAIYKSCYATTYAEAGDLWIAQKELKDIIHHNDYSSYDVTTKAEISFFYYLIKSTFLLENNLYDSDEELSSNIYNRYLNYCYRSFDYDAIAHLRVYSFRNKIAEIMQGNDLESMAKDFIGFDEQEIDGEGQFENFVKNVYFENTNERLQFEYEKVKYMYHFLLCFFNQCIHSNNGTIRTDKILDFACKYLYYYNYSHDSLGEKQISFIDFNDIYDAIHRVVDIIPRATSHDNILYSNGCRIALLNDESELEHFVSTISEYLTFSQGDMFFIACKSEGLLDKTKSVLKKYVQVYPTFRLFSSFEQGIKEFLIFSVFFIIKDDFTDPNNIFVMTPIGTAKSCQYRIFNNVELVDSFLSSDTSVCVGRQKEINAQFRSIIDCVPKELSWESELNSKYYGKCIKNIISVTYDNNNLTNSLKYRYKYSVSEEWREAQLFNAPKWVRYIDNLYSLLKYENPKIIAHRTECSNGASYCSVLMIDNIIDLQNDISINDAQFSETINAFSNILMGEYDKVLIWKGSNNSFVSWRIVLLGKDCPSNLIAGIKQVMCCKGKGLIFAPSFDEPIIKKYSWPEPYEVEDGQDFAFICHVGKDGEVVKRDLNEFFVNYGIHFWYDKERIVDEDSWKQKIEKIISLKNCTKMILLITSEMFFLSKPILYELSLAYKKRYEENEDFRIIPIVYGIASNYIELRNVMISSITDDELYMLIKKVVIPSNEKVITYLMPNQSLLDYTLNEQKDGKNGAVLSALNNK